MKDTDPRPAGPGLAHGPRTLSIPGPSIMPERVLRAMHRPSPNIYEGALVEMTHSLIPDLKRVARTAHHATIYIGNGHAVWEASLANTHVRGDRVLVPRSGLFADGWAAIAAGLGLEVEFVEGTPGRPMDPAAIGARLRADTGHAIRSVLCVHVDTSTSLRADVAAIRREIDAAGHPALLQADCMASLGCDVFEMDAWGVDVMVAGCQKGLMVPAGMAFVFYNDRAARAHDRAAADAQGCVTPYWDWAPRTEPAQYYQFFLGTGPTHHLFGLREALDMLVHEEGVEAAWTRHARLARALWAACDAWSMPGGLELLVPDPAHRSHAVTALRLPGGAAAALRRWSEDGFGLTLGIGLGQEPAADYFRVGHMGHVSGHGMMGTLGGIEAGLAALGVPKGAGALEAAAAVLAGAG